MIATFGNISLWFILSFSIFQFLANYKKNYISKYSKEFIFGLLLSSLITFFTLMYGHIISDFTLINVFENSHTSKPLIYKITGVWGNHEGSMLLWILILSIFNYLIFLLINESNTKFIAETLKSQALIIFGFTLFTLITSNPFDEMLEINKNGLGFNPILQDPALAIHPPLLYVGYVGFSAVFSLAIATLKLKNNETVPWFKYMKTFVLISWTFLTIGIAFGSIWAYYELGWGGWWFWDPVENASLMPWLLGTALLHSLIVVERKKSLQSWVLLLAIISFLLSVIGTFLVRSGILTSVHTFALDPSRGIYILTLAALLGGYSLFLFSLKSKNFVKKNYFSFLSKEGSILVNNLLMIIVCSSIFLGTIYPLIVEVFTNNKISVGEPYYNSTVIPIMIPAILIMGVGPTLAWGKENILEVLKKNYFKILLTLLTTLIIFLIYKSYNLIGVLGVLLAFWIIYNNTFSLLNVKNSSIGMSVAHLGIGLLILGVTGSSVWQNEKIVKINVNNEIKIQKYSVVFENIKEKKGPNYLALQGIFEIYDSKKKLITKLKPENRFYPITNTFTTEASIHTNLLRDLYIVLGEGNKENGWIIRVYHNPLVIWIWIGSLFIFIGGIISINKNLKKIKS